jgi:GAF domain-containing protein
MADPAAFTGALASAAGPAEAFAGLRELARDTIGHTLFTAMTFDRERGEAERIYSDRPEVYPVSGTKPAPRNGWAAAVLERRETFVANTIEAIAEYFPDHEVIASLGCGSILNLPVVVGGEVLGTVNCLAPTGHYTPDRVAAAEILRLPAAACFLFHLVRKGGR